MLNDKIDAVKKIAKRDLLTVRMTLDEDDGLWSVRLTSQYWRQPLCTGCSENLDVALDQVLEKAERSIAPYRDKMKAAYLQAQRDGRRAERRLHDGRF